MAWHGMAWHGMAWRVAVLVRTLHVHTYEPRCRQKAETRRPEARIHEYECRNPLARIRAELPLDLAPRTPPRLRGSSWAKQGSQLMPPAAAAVISIYLQQAAGAAFRMT